MDYAGVGEDGAVGDAVIHCPDPSSGLRLSFLQMLGLLVVDGS